MPGSSSHRRLLSRYLPTALICALLGAAVFAGGCGPAKPESGDRQSRAGGAEWAWLEQTRKTLEEQRARLARGRSHSHPGEHRGPRGPGQADHRPRRRARPSPGRLHQCRPAGSGSAGNRAPAGSSAYEERRGHRPRPPAHRRRGDYQRAIAIYTEDLAVDPGDPPLAAELAKAQGRRYMARDTFAQLKKGMSQDEVRGLLGAPNPHSVRDYPDRGVVGWFYPRTRAALRRPSGSPGATATTPRTVLRRLISSTTTPSSPRPRLQPRPRFDFLPFVSQSCRACAPRVLRGAFHPEKKRGEIGMPVVHVREEESFENAFAPLQAQGREVRNSDRAAQASALREALGEAQAQGHSGP